MLLARIGIHKFRLKTLFHTSRVAVYLFSALLVHPPPYLYPMSTGQPPQTPVAHGQADFGRTPPAATAAAEDPELTILRQVRGSFLAILKMSESMRGDLALLGERFDRLLEKSER